MSKNNYTLLAVNCNLFDEHKLEHSQLPSGLVPGVGGVSCEAGATPRRDVPLVVHTSIASREGNRAVSWLPRGVDIASLEPNDLAILKRGLRWQRKKAVEHLLPDQRVAKCFRYRLKRFVSVQYSSKVKRAFYTGLQICGSIWMCPVCAAKITERRRKELESANTSGTSAFMVTVTIQHNASDKLKDLIVDLNQAWRFVTAGRGWQDFKKENKIMGSVSGREITFGIVNGWHPHIHFLYYSRLVRVDYKKIKSFIASRLAYALEKQGRYLSQVYGVNVIGGNEALQSYLTKMGLEDDKKTSWSLAAEITKAPIKAGRVTGDRFSPFQLLDLYLAGDKFAGQKYIEYALTMKGKNQLFYSKGLRNLLGLDVESTDEEIANVPEESARLFALLSAEDWRKVMKSQCRFGILEVASSGDYDLFSKYCLIMGIDLEVTKKEFEALSK